MKKKKQYLDTIFWLGFLGFLFAFLSSIADIFTAFSTSQVNGLNLPTDVLHFKYLEPLVKNKSFENILLGDYLAIFLIPASILGVYHIYKIMKINKLNNLLTKLIMPIAIYVYTLGTVLHTKSSYVISAMNTNNQIQDNFENSHYWRFLQNSFTPFGWVLVILMLTSLSFFSIYIALGKTPYPKVMFWGSPVILQIYMCIIILFVEVGLKNYLSVVSWNLSMSIFFLISTLWYLKRNIVENKNNEN